MRNNSKIPVICLDLASIGGHIIFNSNDWEGESKTIIFSCSAEYGMLEYAQKRINELCQNANSILLPHFQRITSLTGDPNTLTKCNCFAELSELHLLIEGFVSGLKSLLDIIVQLLSSEQIVNVKIDGFHRDNKTYGGRVLNALTDNVPLGKKDCAQEIIKLLNNEKSKWMDKVVGFRDLLIHPKNGMGMLMLQLDIKVENGQLRYGGARVPLIDSKPLSEFCLEQLSYIKNFCETFLGCLSRHKN